MSDREEFLAWFDTTWRAAEDALHGGDAAPRLETWSTREPVSLLGLWYEAFGADEARDVFRALGGTFSDVASTRIELLVADVRGDFAYTVHRELTSVGVDGTPREYALRVTQVYRREDGAWKVVHRHADRGTIAIDDM
ncbi:nuclear transport factor 2 family protein [Microbacterium sp. ASV81]|uniref:Nuclear transport factor 2 family protein n=1 Tax=Microbacterium capsulatum TaxID=3041921 RepID=A0ABU0XFI5_9MICO|nr:nuclear transport factor 2 family protein [Microbacterium sp. ASV81]MDQ4213867.1 nuclear transport factor 2 family protein [Microbacterium sp. ASV81]